VHSHAGGDCGQLLFQILVAQPAKLLGRQRHARHLRLQLSRRRGDGVERQLRAFRLLFEVLRTIVGIDVVFVVLTHCQHQPHILPRYRRHCLRVACPERSRRALCRSRRREEKRGERCRGENTPDPHSSHLLALHHR
jgi:hypothetical protein